MARKTASKPVDATPATIAEVRAWATSAGFTTALKGRLSAAVREAFTAETGRPVA